MSSYEQGGRYAPDRIISAEDLRAFGFDPSGSPAGSETGISGGMNKSKGEPGPALADEARALLRQQREHWPMLSDNFKSLDTVVVRTFDYDGFSMKLQFNPGRIVSTSAKVDKKTIKERKCFLCQENLPPEQKGLLCGDYMVLGNPFPIFREHFTIPHLDHVPQLILPSFGEMLDITSWMGRYYTLFYNGPRCGASAPDHLHFQAGEFGFMPMDTGWETLVKQHGQWLADTDTVRMARVDDGLRRFVVIESDDKEELLNRFGRLYHRFEHLSDAEEEPMLNVLASHDGGRWCVIVFLRRKHRPDCFFLEGDDRVMFSPASVDFGGVCITPVERDFERMTGRQLRAMFEEVSVTPEVLKAVTSED